MFENAKWIENPDCPAVWAPIFQKHFCLENVTKTEIGICGLGFYILEVNGKRVSDDLLTPPFTAYDKRILYQVYDITQYVKNGINTIEVTCGNGWYNQQEADDWDFHKALWKAAPKMICQVNVGDVCCLVSDESWQTAKSRYIFNSHRLGESYNAGMEVGEFHPASMAEEPEGALKQQIMPSVKLQGTYEGKEIFPDVYDFGQSITGNVKINIKGTSGDFVRIRYSERIRDDGSLDREEICKHTHSERFAEDEYFLAGMGEETWHGEFSFHGFRYVELQYSAGVEILSVTARDIHTDIATIGDYTCDNDDINRLHQACQRAFLTNYIHIPMDCPHREKNGWTADTMLSSFQALYSMDLKESLQKWLDDVVDCQKENGAIPCIAPTSLWGYGWGSGVTWDAALFVVPWNLYRFTGDLAVIKRYYPAMRKYLSFLETQTENDIFTVGLGDWNAPKESVQCDPNMLLTCYAKHVFELFSQMSNLLGEREQEAYAKKRITEIKMVFQEEFIGKHEPCQTYYAALVYFDMVAEKEHAAATLAKLVREADGHIVGGIFGARMVPIVLRDFGYFDLAWEMVCKEEYPGWIYMMNQCHGALGKWDGSASLDHHMFSSIDGFVQESLSGLRWDVGEAGFQKICLQPYFPKDMKEFSFWHKAICGRIEISWNQTIYRAVIPEGVEGTLKLGEQTYQLHTGENTFLIGKQEER